MEIQKVYDSFVYCQNEEEAKKLLLFLAAQGYLWPDGSSLKKNLWTESNKYYFPDSKTKEVTVWDIHAIAYIQNRYKDTSPVITFEQICGVKKQKLLIAVISEKRNKNISTTWYVMEMKYKAEDNVLWITDHRGHVVDFDLNEFDISFFTF